MLLSKNKNNVIIANEEGKKSTGLNFEDGHHPTIQV